MKLIASNMLAIIGTASATLPPGHEDQIWCPKNTCEIYRNSYGITGADSSLAFCYNPSSGTSREGIWTGSLTKTVPPANAIKPKMCTSKQYTECQVEDDCTLEITPANAVERACGCYVSLKLHPFIPKVTSFVSNARCAASACNNRRATCNAGHCEIDFTTGTYSPAPIPSNTDHVSLAEVISFEVKDENIEGEDTFNAFVSQPAYGDSPEIASSVPGICTLMKLATTSRRARV